MRLICAHLEDYLVSLVEISLQVLSHYLPLLVSPHALMVEHVLHHVKILLVIGLSGSGPCCET